MELTVTVKIDTISEDFCFGIFEKLDIRKQRKNLLAKSLARKGANVIMGCRNLEKAETARDQIRMFQ